MEDRLENAMKALVDLLKAKKANLSQPDLEKKTITTLDNQEKFQQLFDETKELLKLSSGINKLKNANICR